ncbi:MAG: hypothetical protein ACRDQA_02870 [Nocardioidaceae bacterium]
MNNIEPCADFRGLAATMWQAYTAYTQVGFTEAQAMQLLCTQARGTAGT